MKKNVVIISSKDDKELIKQYQSVGWQDQIYETEFILSAALKQKLNFALKYSGGSGGKRTSAIGCK